MHSSDNGRKRKVIPAVTVTKVITTMAVTKGDGETTSGRKSGAGKTTALWNEVQTRMRPTNLY